MQRYRRIAGGEIVHIWDRGTIVVLCTMIDNILLYNALIRCITLHLTERPGRGHRPDEEQEQAEQTGDKQAVTIHGAERETAHYRQKFLKQRNIS